MAPHLLSIRANSKDQRHCRRLAMRNAWDAFTCSDFRYLEDHLTVSRGSGLAGHFLPSGIP